MEEGRGLLAIIDMLYALRLQWPTVDDLNGLLTADDVLRLVQMDITAVRGEIQEQIRHINTINRQQGTGVG